MQPEVVLVLPTGHTTEAPKDKVVISVVPGVPDDHIMEQTIVCPNDVVHP